MNCQGLRTPSKRRDVIDYLSHLGANIICLQDTHWLDDDIPLIKQIWNGHCILCGNKRNSRGVAILFKKNFEYKVENVMKDENGNLMCMDISLSNISLRLVNIYAPNTDSPEFFENIKEKIETNLKDYIVICGDFNLALDPNMDTSNYKNINNPNARLTLLKIIQSHNLVDAYRFLHENTKRYTWRRRNPTQQARLDYFIVSNQLLDLINTCTIRPSYRSDHSIIELNIKPCNFIKGKGVWKFNCSLLREPEYLTLINNTIDAEKMMYAVKVYNLENLNTIKDQNIQFTVDDSQFLEVLLLKIRGETIKFATGMKKKQNAEENKLILDIETLEKSGSVHDSDSLEAKKVLLQEIRDKKLKGSYIRSRAKKWLKEGEKPSKFFCSLEKIGYLEKTVKQLIHSDGQIITDQKLILEKVQEFYKGLFQSKEHTTIQSDLKQLFSETLVNKLTQSESLELEGPLTIDELNISLKAMKNGRSGIDGFPADFFKTFLEKTQIFGFESFKLCV